MKTLLQRFCMAENDLLDAVNLYKELRELKFYSVDNEVCKNKIRDTKQNIIKELNAVMSNCAEIISEMQVEE